VPDDTTLYVIVGWLEFYSIWACKWQSYPNLYWIKGALLCLF